MNQTLPTYFVYPSTNETGRRPPYGQMGLCHGFAVAPMPKPPAQQQASQRPEMMPYEPVRMPLAQQATIRPGAEVGQQQGIVSREVGGTTYYFHGAPLPTQNGQGFDRAYPSYATFPGHPPQVIQQAYSSNLPYPNLQPQLVLVVYNRNGYLPGIQQSAIQYHPFSFFEAPNQQGKALSGQFMHPQQVQQHPHNAHLDQCFYPQNSRSRNRSHKKNRSFAG